MLPVLHGDVVAAARCLRAVAPPRRRRLMLTLITLAEVGHRVRCLTGRAHPRFGNGCLETATAGFTKMPEAFLDDMDYCGCMLTVFETLVAYRAP